MTNERKIITMFDDEWDDAVKDLDDDELVKYGEQIMEAMSQNPQDFPGITPEMLEQMRVYNEDFKASIELSRIADREAAIATARMEASADAYLTALANNDKSKGN